MKFIDEATIQVHAGKGGDGSASFRREKFVPKGGPDGGDGGHGGSIWGRADLNINTLVDYRYARIHRAKNGDVGRGSDCNGRGAEDVWLRFPVGTVIRDEEGNVVADLAEHDQTVLLAKGGRGGLGNLHFKSSTNRTPRQFTRGLPGESRELTLELKVLADVGLLGMPNAGKSTFIRAVSAARPKVADYPFTTLHPNLGVVRVDDNRSFVLADIPGLIEGAAEGAGLGHQFLRHLARTRLLLHIVDLAPFESERDPVAEAQAIVEELRKYDPDLYAKPRWLVLNKLDLIPEDERDARCDAFVEAIGGAERVFRISAIDGTGCRELAYAVMGAIEALRPAVPPSARRSGTDSSMDAEDPRGIVIGDEDGGTGMTLRSVVADARRIVVKVGSSLVTNEGAGLDRVAISGWAEQIAALVRSGRQVVLVSSGAIAEGMQRLGWRKRPHAVQELQAAAAVGQMGLVQVYETCFSQHGLRTAQILLTHDDLADRKRYLNARSALETLLALGTVPVINENDTVVTDEIKFGDNDTLGALVANLIVADCLIILTDQTGLYTADPRRDPSATLVREAVAGSAELESMAGGAGSAIGKGGMLTKVLAARRAARSGAHTVIASGREAEVLLRLAAGEAIGSELRAQTPQLSARKQWLADHLQVAGTLTLDAGAAAALARGGRSLLPIGVTACSGRFERGDVVCCLDPAGREIARGLANYGADEAARILRRPSAEIETILGYVDEPELIHRDNLVIL